MRLSGLALLTSLALCWPRGDAAAQPVDNVGAVDGPGEIVVTAPRRGEAEVPVETEFGEEEIASHGADSIDELLESLAPLIDGSGEEPVILVNGKEIGFDRSILGFPPEALNRIALLKAEDAAHYGHRSGRRVVNLVLKENYASRNIEAAVNWATDGGQYDGALTAGQVAISGATRWNAQARLSIESALRNSARGARPSQAGPIDLVGYVAPVSGDEIDPGLSGLAGVTVGVAAIPGRALAGAPVLADFVAGAGRTNPADPARFETLLPSRRKLSLNLGASRPLGPFTASLSLNASSNHSERLRGLPMASIVIPQGSPWSPFSGDVLLVRPLAGARALRSENSSKSLGLSLTLSGSLGSWRTTLSTSYARSWSTNHLEHGVDTREAQALIDAHVPGFNPYMPWSDRLLRTSGSKSDSESFGGNLSAARPVVDLPAGPMTATLSMTANHNSSGYRSLGGESQEAWDATAYDHLGGELSVSIPVSARGEGELNPLGDLSIDLSAGGQTATGSAFRKQHGAGFTWTPVPPVQVLGSFEHREVVPSSEDLGAPRVETVTRVYDFLRQEVAEPLWITGGNPLLSRGSAQSLSLEVRLRPLGSPLLSVNVGYRSRRGEGGVAPFPELTPAMEAAFPERVVRDAEGRLQMVDARPINIARSRSAELVSSVALRLPTPGARAANTRTADPLRLTFTLNHTWRLESELLTREGVPTIDQLAETGQSRHYLSLQATGGKKGIGGDLRATWSSPAQVRSRHSAGRDYRYRPPLMINAGVFILPGKLWTGAEGIGWLENLKVSLEVENLLDTYRRVTLSDGSVPPGFSRHEVDPLGRTVELSVRKRF